MKKLHSIRKWLLLFLALAIASTITTGQNTGNDIPKVTETYALTGAKVITSPGQVLENATVVIDKGLITAVGQNVRIPVHAQTIKADSMYIYAGFIDPLNHTGYKKPKASDNNQRPPVRRNTADPSNEDAGIRPDHSVLEHLDANDKSISQMREAGYTMVHTVPDGPMIAGTGAVIVTSGNSKEELLIKDNASLYATLSGGRGVYPSTVIGVMAKWRDFYRNAETASSHLSKFGKAAGMERPVYDEATRAMIPAIKKEIPIFFKANDLQSMYRIMTLQKDLGFNLVLGDCKQAWHMADDLRNNRIPVILSLDLPEDKSKKKKEKEEDEEEKVKEMTDAEKEVQALKDRKEKSMKEHYSQAAVLASKGVEVTFSNMSAKPGNLKKSLKTMMEHGLSEDDALAALTTHPAKLIGVDQIAGTVSKGKMANLLVSNRPVFEEDAQFKYIFVDGTKYEYEIKEKKEKKKSDGDPDAPTAAIAGTWKWKMNTPDQERNGEFVFTGANGEIEGEAFNPDMGTGGTELSNIDLDGNELSFNMVIDMGGQSMELNYEMTIEGDSMEGTVSVGQFGTFDIEAEKDPQ